MGSKSEKARKRAHVLAQGEMQRHRCCFCRVPMWYQSLAETGNPDDMATYEHITPASQGSASYSKYNCLVSCILCNSLRADEDVELFGVRVATFGRLLLQKRRAALSSMTSKARTRRKKARQRERAKFIPNPRRFNYGHLTH